MALRLSVPAPLAFVSIKPETNPARLHQWLMGLSNTDHLSSSTTLLDALSTLNRYKLDADDRELLLEHYQTAVDMRSTGLAFFFGQNPLPLTGQAREARQRLASLLSELAIAYKLILLERFEKRRGFASGKAAPALILRILQLLLQQLELAYDTYSPIPQGVWSDFHQLFLLAVQHRWLDAPEGSRETISICYKRALLLALADPYRLPPGAFERARTVIADMGSLAQFESASDIHAETGGFWVRLDEDRPPFFAVQQPDDLDGRTDIVLNTNLLGRTLARHIVDLERKTPSGSEEIQGLRQLLRFWTVTPRRGFQRLKNLAQVEVRLGWPVMTTQRVGQQPWPEAVGGGFLWRVVNESPGGFALSGERLGNLSLAIGLLVGVRPMGSERWLIAVVRWLQQRGDSVEIGVQVMAPWGRVALLKNETSQHPVLLLPAIKGVRQPSTVISPDVLPLSEYQLQVDEVTQESVVLSRVLERTPNLIQMVYKLSSGSEEAYSTVLAQAVSEFRE